MAFVLNQSKIALDILGWLFCKIALGILRRVFCKIDLGIQVFVLYTAMFVCFRSRLLYLICKTVSQALKLKISTAYIYI